MKTNSVIVLVFFSVVFVYVVLIFRTFTPAPDSTTVGLQQRSVNLPPPLDTALIAELEGRISAEHSAVLKYKEQLSSLQDQYDEDKKNIQTYMNQIQSLNSQIESLQKGKAEYDSGGNDIEILEKSKEIDALKESLAQLQKQKSNVQQPPLPLSTSTMSTGVSPSHRPGVIVLGMHRSGTSVIGGLMTKMGLKTGGPLIGAAKDNAKGFFERIDVVLQNDYIMKNQHVHYSYNTHKYDPKRGLRDVIMNQDKEFFNEGRRALAFLNNEKSYPWMLKDPRLCITLRTWLPLLNFVPAILFAYRNPYDVALSMHNRETERFSIQQGLKLWYVYNKRAIGQSHDLCRVVTSHKRVLSDPTTEMNKIYNGLRACGVNVPHVVNDVDIRGFVDTSLQHGKTKTLDTLCDQESVDYESLVPPDTWSTTDSGHLHLYRACIRAFCDIEDGSAFNHDYTWDESITNS